MTDDSLARYPESQIASGGQGWNTNEDPSDVRGDLELAISARRQGACDRLGVYLDAQAQPVDDAFIAAENTSLLPAIQFNDTAEQWKWRLIAAHDHLQLELVPLRKLLDHVCRLAACSALQSQVFLVAAVFAKLGYSFLGYIRTVQPSQGIHDLLWGILGTTTTYSAYKSAMWSLIYLRRRAVTCIKQRLDENSLTERNRHDLDSWSWNTVEWYAGHLSRS